VTYAVKEIFPTLQGEGFHTGRKAVFVRFVGCNLWTGREQDRAKAVCQFCDTDFLGGTRMTAREIADTAVETWGGGGGRFLVFTGGEPLLQLDRPLLGAMRAQGFEVAVETNGTRAVPDFDLWVTVSPKAGARLAIWHADELKLVYPQDGLPPESLRSFHTDNRFLQPMDGPNLKENTEAAIAYCLAHPEWRLSVQTHKVVGLR
jgi:7-carboxy-7-deazaguanine synthase (Cx14CxxC type)